MVRKGGIMRGGICALHGFVVHYHRRRNACKIMHFAYYVLQYACRAGRWKQFNFVVQTCANNIRGIFIFINVILFLNFQGGFSLLVIKPVQILQI